MASSEKALNDTGQLTSRVTLTTAKGESHPEIDVDAQYKIAKKKELLVKKIN